MGGRGIARMKFEGFSAKIQGRLGVGGRAKPVGLKRGNNSRVSGAHEVVWGQTLETFNFQTGGLELVHKAVRSHWRKE